MAEKILAYALTTVARVKDRMQITVSDNDSVLQRLVNAVTDFIEGETGRRFKETTYTDEVYSFEDRQAILAVRNIPVTALSDLKFRAGTPSQPNYTSLSTDQYELLENGQTGLIQLYGMIFGNVVNVLKVTYTAGYKINFSNAGDAGDATPTHTLPADLTDLAERLVVRWWKRRELGGKLSEGLQGGSIQWKDLLDSEDVETINRYRRPPAFV